jgi:hypothetical protein
MWGSFLITENEMTRKAQVKIDAPFFCKNLQEDVSIGRCLDLFVEANAFGFKDSACFKCVQGQKVRQSLAHD